MAMAERMFPHHMVLLKHSSIALLYKKGEEFPHHMVLLKLQRNTIIKNGKQKSFHTTWYFSNPDEQIL